MEWKEMKKEILKNSENGKKFGYYTLISNIGHELNKDELLRIVKEIDYAMYSALDTYSYNEIITETVNALDEHFEDEL